MEPVARSEIGGGVGVIRVAGRTLPRGLSLKSMEARRLNGEATSRALAIRGQSVGSSLHLRTVAPGCSQCTACRSGG